jgi:hypothetical protein
MNLNELWPVTFWQVLMLNIVIAISCIYLLYKYRKSNVYVFVILMFFPALFAFWGTSILNLYKIILISYCVYISSIRNYFSKTSHREKWIVISFFIFSFSFFTSTLLNNDSFTLSFSQYSRFAIIFCGFLLLKNELSDPKYDSNKLENLIYDILLVQIIVSIAKFFIIGVLEGLVGTISFNGGGEGTSLPILAFIFIWYIRKGIFLRKEYILILAFLFIGYMAGKRAIWFIMPCIIALFMYYIPERRNIKSLIIGIFLIPVVFYLGVRLTPTLNREHKVFGEFDLNYAFDYAQGYSFGSDKVHKINAAVAEGRGGVLLKLYNDFLHKNVSNDFLWGHGLTDIYTSSYEQFQKKGYGIDHLGSATGAFQSYISGGFIGVFTTLFFSLSMLSLIINIRVRIVIIGIFLWDYLYYSGLIIRTPALMFLLLFVVVSLSYKNDIRVQTST